MEKQLERIFSKTLIPRGPPTIAQSGKDFDPVKWNREFEEFLEADPTFGLRVPPSEMAGTAEAMSRHHQSQGTLSSIELETRLLCDKQFEIASNVQPARAKHFFESTWINMSAEQREVHLLYGLVDTCSLSVDMEQYRCLCPESTLAFLESNQGDGFLRLLATVCPRVDTPASMRTYPIFISNPDVSNLPTATSDQIMHQRTISLCRALFLSYFLSTTFCHIYGVTNSKTQTIKAPLAKDSAASRKEVLATMGIPKEDIKEIQKVYAEDRKAAVWRCSRLRCGIKEDSQRRLLLCAKCTAGGRKIHYCGRECQVADWKRHKPTCGKPLPVVLEPIAGSPISPLSSTIRRLPPAAPGFIRSKALTRQLGCLATAPPDDPTPLQYIIWDKQDGTDKPGCVCMTGDSAILFEHYRDAAITRGDRQSIITIRGILTHGMTEAAKEAVIKQLSEEYEMDAKDLASSIRGYQGMDKKLLQSLKAQASSLPS